MHKTSGEDSAFCNACAASICMGLQIHITSLQSSSYNGAAILAEKA